MSSRVNPIAAIALRSDTSAKTNRELNSFLFTDGPNLAAWAILTGRTPRSAALTLVSAGLIDRNDPRAIAAADTSPRSSDVLEMTRTGIPGKSVQQAIKSAGKSVPSPVSRARLHALSETLEKEPADLVKCAAALDGLALDLHKEGHVPRIAATLARASSGCAMAAHYRNPVRELSANLDQTPSSRGKTGDQR